MSYAYNAENRLVTASGGTYHELMDDSLDRLHRYYDGSANRWLYYDGPSLIAEYGSGGTVLLWQWPAYVCDWNSSNLDGRGYCRRHFRGSNFAWK